MLIFWIKTHLRDQHRWERTYNYRPQTKLQEGYVFTPVFHSVLRGACMVARGHVVVARQVGMCGCQRACVVARGCAWLWGACVVAEGVCGGGVCVVPGACMVPGGHVCWQGGMCGIRWDTVNERAVRILLECILVSDSVYSRLKR